MKNNSTGTPSSGTLTRKQFQRIVARIYFTVLLLSTALFLFLEYRMYNYAEISLREALWKFIYLDDVNNISMFFLFLGPTLLTGFIALLLRIGTKLTPLTEEEKQMNFLERLSVVELFMCLYPLLLVPLYLATKWWICSVPHWLFYLLVIVHFAATWLLTLLLKRIAQITIIRKKITSLLLYLALVALYTFGLPIVIYAAADMIQDSVDSYATVGDDSPVDEVTYADEDGEEEPQIDYSWMAEAGYEELSIEELTNQVVQQLKDLYDLKSGDADDLAVSSSLIINYVGDRELSDIPSELDSRRLDGQELIDATANREKEYDLVQPLGYFFYYYFRHANTPTQDNMSNLLRRALLLDASHFNMKAFQTRINLLDYAYRDLMAQGVERHEDYPTYRFEEIYDLACEGNANYKDYFDSPYLFYVTRNEYDPYLTQVWAYTFWGRRYADGTFNDCRKILDKVLDVYPNYPLSDDAVDRANADMQRAGHRVKEFYAWYAENYSSFEQLKVAQYGENGALELYDPDVYNTYFKAVEKSGFLSPAYLAKIKASCNRRYANTTTATGKIDPERGEWLRYDPILLGDFKALIPDVSSLSYKTSYVTAPDKMFVDVTDDFGEDVIKIDGEWYLDSSD